MSAPKPSPPPYGASRAAASSPVATVTRVTAAPPRFAGGKDTTARAGAAPPQSPA